MCHYTFENNDGWTKNFVFRMLIARDAHFYGTIAIQFRFSNKSGNVSSVCPIIGQRF
jgi:hypothetical protein